jgi:putative serine protease PepD
VTQQQSVPAPTACARRAAAVAVLAATTLAVAACTSGSGSSSASSSESASASGSAASSSGAAPARAGSATDLENAYQRVIQQVLPSVVEIRTEQALGSGVVFDDHGHVVTNAHVVGSATSFQVYLSGRAKPVAATLQGTYAPSDLAVITLAEPSVARAARFGRSADLKVGDIVLAMGNPLGLTSSVTNGIVSALGRTVSEPQGEGSPGATIADAIQTSAAINPGNSGGALVDLGAEVVGIPTLAAVSPEGGGAAPGIGFAISSDTVRRIAPQLIATGRVTNSGRAALGVRVSTVTDAQGDPQGVGVVSVTPGGAAAKAGIQAGDVIVSVAGQPTPTAQALSGVLATLKVGQQVEVGLRRGSSGSTTTVTVTLGQLTSP